MFSNRHFTFRNREFDGVRIAANGRSRTLLEGGLNVKLRVEGTETSSKAFGANTRYINSLIVFWMVLRFERERRC